MLAAVCETELSWNIIIWLIDVVMLFAAPDMETSMDGNAAVDFLEELEGSLKAVEPGALTERFTEG